MPRAPEGVIACAGAHVGHVDILVEINHVLALRMHLHQHLVLPHHLYSRELAIIYYHIELMTGITSATYIKTLVLTQLGDV